MGKILEPYGTEQPASVFWECQHCLKISVIDWDVLV